MASPDITHPAARGPATDDEVSDALLRAARELMGTHGIRHLRMDDVARRAGCGRATLYRRFSTRDELVWGVVVTEMRDVLAGIEAAISPVRGFRERLVEAFACTVEGVKENPLLHQLLAIEPDLLLPHLTIGGAETLALSRSHLVRLLARGQADGEIGPMDLELVADLIVRLAHSLLLTPGGPIPTTDPVALRRFARTHLADPILRLNR